MGKRPPTLGVSPLGSLHADKMEIRRLRRERDELAAECERLRGQLAEWSDEAVARAMGDAQ